MTFGIIMGFYVFVLSCFAGYQLIAKVPGTLHTPLMSGANAISGISIVGALLTAGLSENTPFGIGLGVAAVICASINVAGGYLVTHRMLGMFKHKGKGK